MLPNIDRVTQALNFLFTWLFPNQPDTNDPPLPVATITKTIGTGKDYSTVTAWEADLDVGAIYASGDTALGEMYNQTFDEAVTINGGGTIGLVGIILRGASGQRHSGIMGTGARFVQSSAKAITLTTNLTNGITLSWLGFDFGNFSLTNSITSGATSTTNEMKIWNNIIYNAAGPGGTGTVVNIPSNKVAFVRNMILNCAGASGSGIYRGFAPPGSRIMNQSNNTVYNITKAGTGNCYGFGGLDNAVYTAQNNVGCSNGGSTSGTKKDFEISSPASAVMDHNLSSDTSATGTGSLTSKTAGNQFVSTTGGSEDLHLKSGADAINAGTDLVTTPTNVNIDIDGRDVDAQGDVWDMGADEYVSASTIYPPYYRILLALNGGGP